MNVLSPSKTSAYAPLADDVHPSSSSNGAVVYTRRLSPTPTLHSPSSLSPASGAAPLARSESEETLGPLPGERDDGDLGTVRIRRDKGKGKERAYDQEAEGRAAYPPVNEAEDEERRIRDNLAQLAARDQARRRAARLSRQIPSSPDPNTLSPVSSGSSAGRSRPLSAITEGVSRRSSILGTISSVLGGGGAQKKAWDGELPMSAPATGVYTNPYDPPAPPSFPAAPRMTVTPPTTSPFLDPEPRLSSSTIRADPISPTSPTEAGFTYGGPGWRGGQAQAAARASEQGARPTHNYREGHGEKWWHALCAWGDDLDGGHGTDNGDQAGRTNPFE
ncbi:hypothetical protein Q5752_001554 [Cryptotrichosporon argae]